VQHGALKVTFSLILLFLSVSAEPVHTQGHWKVGGGITYENNGGALYMGYDDYGNEIHGRANLLEISPSMGYFIFKGLCVGTDLLFQWQHNGPINYTGYGLSPYVEYYFGSQEGKSKITPYVGIEGYFMRAQSNLSYPSISATRVISNDVWSRNLSYYGYGGDVGGNLLLTSCVGVFCEVNFLLEYSKPDNRPSVGGNSLGSKVGLNIFL